MDVWRAAHSTKCASVGCGSRAIWHFESGGVGSDYCDQCRDRIDDQIEGDDAHGDEYCEHCHNTGEVDCYCGGDLCVCENNGTYPCPHCS